MRYRNINFNKGLVAFLALLTTLIGVTPQNALAYDSGPDGDTSPVTTVVPITPVEYKQPSVTITINNGQAIQAKTLQSVNGNYASGEISVPVTVKVENAGAYSIGAHTTNSNLVGKTNANNKIPSTTSAKTLAQLSNTWGFRVGNGTTYAAMPTTTNTTNVKARTTLGKDSATTATENATLYFGTNINGDLPADTYTGTIVISALAELTTLANVTNMQDVAPEHCAATEDGTTVTLTDKRDSKKYLVTKMKDGKCWMTQNLALAGGTVLNTTTSNVSNYTLPASSTTGFSSDTAQYMYNGTHIDGTADSATNTGAYYSFLAATANTGSGSSGDANGSICPKGWRLPTGGADSEFVSLVKKYGGSGENGDDAIKYGSAFAIAFKTALVGRYNDSGFNSSDVYANYWSSTIAGGANGYNLNIGTNVSNPQSYANYNKRNGFSVRCLLSS